VFWSAKGIDHKQPGNQTKCITMMVANLDGVASTWYQDRVQSLGFHPTNVYEIITALKAEFVPSDLQDRLRDLLDRLCQARCVSPTNYISEFRRIVVRITDMSELDKATFFTRGLLERTRNEIRFRECKTVSEAMSVALRYERAFFEQRARDEDRGPRRLHHGLDRGHDSDRHDGQHYRGHEGRGRLHDRSRGRREREHGREGGQERGCDAGPQRSLTTGVNYNDVARRYNLCFNCHVSDHSSKACKLQWCASSERLRYF